jgi:hypothetical protein
MSGFIKRWRRARLRATPFPAEWRAFVERNVPIFRRLSPDDQNELLGHAQVILAEKNFEACGGLVLTDEMRVTIAAQASILLLHRTTDYYPRLTSILIYPGPYVVPETRPLAGGMWQEGDSVRLGHTGARLDALVISWNDTLRGARRMDDGHNVVLHEFAHQLDFEDRATNGTPLLQTRSQYAAWFRALEPEYEALRAAADEGATTFLDQYGATSPAEFFAVVTEFFFEKPRELLEKHPVIYQQLLAFYQQDPASWKGGTNQ